ncbi:hypothetical protein K1719_017872 [Acacia pycnantha]|nr:hypothetical protein K1719_017872 [Acacia pycnantha]
MEGLGGEGKEEITAFGENLCGVASFIQMWIMPELHLGSDQWRCKVGPRPNIYPSSLFIGSFPFATDVV